MTARPAPTVPTQPTATPPAATQTAATRPEGLAAIVPLPVEVSPRPGSDLTLTLETRIHAAGGAPGVRDAALLLAEQLRPATGFPLPVLATVPGDTPDGITLALTDPDPAIGEQGYRLDINAGAALLRAATPAGLLAGVQTVLQMLPADIESAEVQPGPWTLPGCAVVDHPHYAYRGCMLDLARYWFSLAFVERFIDQLARYKINYLHLHLTDDQGWRIQIDSWPRLGTHGGSTQTEGGPAGYLSKADYRHLVRYAARRGITIVPEIEMPGHVAAALASYPELGIDGAPTELYTGYDVGFSALAVDSPRTRQFVDDVLRELAELTPGPYLHIGGEEAVPVDAEPYQRFIRYVESVVTKYGKQLIGWHEVLTAATPATSIGQYWYAWSSHPPAAEAAEAGARFILSPANHAYLDAKYTPTEPEWGHVWAGTAEARDAYEWDPDTTIDGVSGDAILGIESTLFTSLTPTESDVQLMVFPRMPAIAELSWTPPGKRDWTSLSHRLAGQAARWRHWNVNYYPSPQIPW